MERLDQLSLEAKVIGEKLNMHFSSIRGLMKVILVFSDIEKTVMKMRAPEYATEISQQK